MRRNGEQGEYPDVGYARYIIDTMMAIGYPSVTEGRVSHQEIVAYCQGTGAQLNSAEHSLIYMLFIEYANAKHEYEHTPSEPAPYPERTDDYMREQANNMLERMRARSNG